VAVTPSARARLRLQRGTIALGVGALGLTGAVLGGEVVRIWRRGTTPRPGESVGLLDVGRGLARETAAVAVAGYEGGTRSEHALLNLLGSYLISAGTVRVATHVIRRHGTYGPFRNIRVGERHVHHFVPGIVTAFLAGGASIVARDERLGPFLAIPFGAGVALTLDESALLLKLDDVYWTEEGIVSVQIMLAALGGLAGAALLLKLLRRGEEQVLQPVTSAP
jgi:hypothetical protein